MSDRTDPRAPRAQRVPDAHFERRYRAAAEPWRLEDRWYEPRKRALSMACLTRPRYRRAFEPGCGPGLLTELLADRCDELLAVDASATAVSGAACRVSGLAHVSVRVMAVPDAWPVGWVGGSHDELITDRFVAERLNGNLRGDTHGLLTWPSVMAIPRVRVSPARGRWPARAHAW